MRATLSSAASIAALIALPTIALAGGWEAPSELPTTAATPLPLVEVDGEVSIVMASGGRSGMYYPGAEVVDAFMPEGFDVDAMVTGGTWDNILRAVNGEVHAIVAQPDGIALLADLYPQHASNFTLVGGLHREYSLVLCNRDRADFSSVAGDLEDSNVRLAIVGQNSGANLMFGNWIREDRGYGRTDVRYYGTMSEALTTVRSGQNHCLLLASGLSSPLVQEIDLRDWREIRLIESDDSDLNDTRGPDGERIYTFVDLPRDAFSGLSKWETDDSRGWSIETISWQAGVYAYSPAFEGPTGAEAFSALVESMRRAGPAMQAAEDAALDGNS